MEESSIQVFLSSAIIAAYGKSIQLFRKFGLIPFGWDAVEQKITTSSNRKSFFIVQVQKFLHLTIIGLNPCIMMVGAIRVLLTADDPSLKKLKQLIDAGLYLCSFYACIIVHRTADGIPSVINNLSNLVRGSSGNLPVCNKKVLPRFLKSLSWITILLATVRAIPILWNPQRPQYVTSFLDEPESCGAFTRVIAGLVHFYAYGLSIASMVTAMEASIVTSHMLVLLIHGIK